MQSAQFSVIKLYCADPELLPQAEELVEKFQLEQEYGINPDTWSLQLTEQGLALVAPESFRFAPFQFSFNDASLLKRAKELGKSNGLVKALGAKSREPLLIIDATAGLGRDAFLMASLGHQVFLIESNPVLAAMLDDALRRAAKTDIAVIASRMQLVWADSKDVLSNWETKGYKNPDVVYLDPMFPEQQKSALVKKDMQILQHIIGHGQKADYLLNLALAKAGHRVVVKRPRLGPYLSDKSPDLQFIGKTQRFDVYLIPKPQTYR